MKNAAHQLADQLQAKVIGHVDLGSPSNHPAPHSGEMNEQRTGGRSTDDAFLFGQSDFTRRATGLDRELGRVLGEIKELQAENRWPDIVTLFWPIEEKLAEFVEAGLDEEIRLKLSFALCRLGKNEQAIDCLLPLVAKNSQRYLAHYSIGYAVLDLFFRARTERRIIPVKKRVELLKLAHHHFDRARGSKPDSVTFCYRQAVLYKEIEDKPKQAAPLFQQAIENWRRLTEDERQRFHQQRPKYIKSTYHLASCLLTLGQPKKSYTLLTNLLQEDSASNYMHPLFKHFAVGKVLYALGRYKEGIDHLVTAIHRAERGQATDFVHELAARCELALQRPHQALRQIDRIEPHRRRPYVRWTEADTLVALDRIDDAIALLERCAELDKRARHVALIKLCRMRLQRNEMDQALAAAREAVSFCLDLYGNASHEARFWEAVCLHRLGRNREALPIIEELQDCRYTAADLVRLSALVKEALAIPARNLGDGPVLADTSEGRAGAASLKKIK